MATASFQYIFVDYYQLFRHHGVLFQLSYHGEDHAGVIHLVTLAAYSLQHASLQMEFMHLSMSCPRASGNTGAIDTNVGT